MTLNIEARAMSFSNIDRITMMYVVEFYVSELEST